MPCTDGFKTFQLFSCCLQQQKDAVISLNPADAVENVSLLLAALAFFLLFFFFLFVFNAALFKQVGYRQLRS